MSRKLSFYLAAAFKEQLRLRNYAEELRNMGYVITSRWLFEERDPLHDLQKNEDYSIYAEQDLEDIRACDVFIIFTVEPTELIKRGGKHFEAGYASGVYKPIVVIGPDENIFYQLKGTTHFNSWSDFISSIKTPLGRSSLYQKALHIYENTMEENNAGCL